MGSALVEDLSELAPVIPFVDSEKSSAKHQKAQNRPRNSDYAGDQWKGNMPMKQICQWSYELNDDQGIEMVKKCCCGVSAARNEKQ